LPPRDRRPRSPDVHPLGEILDGLLKERPIARGLPLGRLAARWSEVVGDKLAEETLPVRLEGGVLSLAVTTSAWGAQVSFLASDIARKANELLGSKDVKEVRVHVGPDRARKDQNRRSKRQF
jgi:predicted nucleic acid-binding Zn ribbon protein